jgi:hypothetical protein
VIKDTIASILNIFIGKAHADSLLPVEQLPYCSIYAPDPVDCKSATHLFPYNFIDNIKQLNPKTNTKPETKLEIKPKIKKNF